MQSWAHACMSHARLACIAQRDGVSKRPAPEDDALPLRRRIHARRQVLRLDDADCGLDVVQGRQDVGASEKPRSLEQASCSVPPAAQLRQRFTSLDTVTS